MHDPDSSCSADIWNAARSRISHDSLKNGLAIALGKYSNVLAGVVEDADAGNQLLASLSHWPTLRDEILHLIRTGCEELSPAALFRRWPLDALDEKSKDMLSSIIDGRWREGVKPEQWTAEAEDALKRMDIACQQLKETLQAGGVGDATQITMAREAVANFSETLSRLSRCKDWP